MDKERTEGNMAWYLAQFDQLQKDLNGKSQEEIHRVRRRAIDQLALAGFPTTKDEEWKYTDIRPLLKTDFEFSNSSTVTESDIENYRINGLDSYQLVFINGNFRKDLSMRDDLPGNIQISPLHDYLENNKGALGNELTKHTPAGMDAFTALNTAFLHEGVVIVVPKNVVVDKPVHIIHVNNGRAKTISTPRNLIVAEQGSELKVIESFGGLGSEEYFTNAVSEIIVGANAKIEHFKIQNENDAAFHVSSVFVHQERDSNYTSHNFVFGGKLVRNNISSKLDGEGINCILNGLYIGAGQQHIDNHTTIDHAKPNCHSEELYKGILDDKARGVFNGKIFVRQDAQKTNAIQNNNTILLSDNANIDTKPQLEIFADDVRCTHGATIGQLDEDAYFYLRSRGIDKVQARQLLIFAFASDVIDRVEIDPLRENLAGLLAKKLHTIRPE